MPVSGRKPKDVPGADSMTSCLDEDA